MATRSKACNKTQLEQYRKMLEERREELVSSVRSYAEDVPDVGLQGASGDSADHASNDYAVELFGAILEKQAGTLEEVDRALGKVQAGEYGLCESCGEAIVAKRLKVIPWARYCRDCQEKQDRMSAYRRSAAAAEPTEWDDSSE
ncbi:MAG: TraR/DksA family transcriptional regulator [Phycisphaerae bacterium]|nr:TraR/DksA family transcriptional regulator [Phycisphaerae bacterium]